MRHLPFHQRYNPAADKGQHEVAQRRDGQTLQIFIGHGDDVISAEHQVRNADDGNDRGLLDDGDKLIAEGGERDAALSRLVDDLNAAGVRIKYVPRAQLDALSSHGAHQGIALEVGNFPYADVADILDRAGDGPALVVVLDHVTDDGNFGAIVRSAEVVGAAGVIIANKRAAGVTVGSYKTSAGAVMHLPIAQVPNIARALDDLKAAGFWVGGASEHAEGSCWDAPFEGRVALVMGSEGDGISRLVLEKCDFLTKLPQRGMTESLNVAQATTALCFEWLRRNAGELMGEE